MKRISSTQYEKKEPNEAKPITLIYEVSILN